MLTLLGCVGYYVVVVDGWYGMVWYGMGFR